MALVGRLRHAEHRRIPEIHQELIRRGLVVAQRTVTNLLDRYDELRALATADPKRLEPLLREQRRVILAIDGLQPDVGHEVLWVLRDCLSGEILLARSLLSSTAKDLAGLITEVKEALPVPIFGGLGGTCLLDELAVGAAGAMTGFSVPAGLVACVNAYAEGGFAAARAAWIDYLPLVNFEFQQGIALGLRKESLRLQGIIDHATVRAPAPAVARSKWRRQRCTAPRMIPWSASVQARSSATAHIIFDCVK
jgi:hypothetical protein